MKKPSKNNYVKIIIPRQGCKAKEICGECGQALPMICSELRSNHPHCINEFDVLNCEEQTAWVKKEDIVYETHTIKKVW